MAEKKIWVIGASGFAFKIGAQFSKVPGEGNSFGGFIDSREQEIALTKKYCERIGLSVQFAQPANFDFSDQNNYYLFGVGDAQFKKNFTQQHKIDSRRFHRFEWGPDISEFSETLPGIYWRCVVSSNAKIGYATFIDTNSVIGHNSVIGNYCHIAVGVIVGGNVSIGDATYIHSGAIIGNNVTIGENCVIGVGATVVRNLPPGSKIIAPKSPSI